MNNPKYLMKCEKCGKTYNIDKYIYRINFDSVDPEDFKLRERFGVDLCPRCRKEVIKLIFFGPGPEEELGITYVKSKEDK